MVAPEVAAAAVGIAVRCRRPSELTAPDHQRLVEQSGDALIRFGGLLLVVLFAAFMAVPIAFGAADSLLGSLSSGTAICILKASSYAFRRLSKPRAQVSFVENRPGQSLLVSGWLEEFLPACLRDDSVRSCSVCFQG